jgi:hypothetical protein
MLSPIYRKRREVKKGGAYDLSQETFDSSFTVGIVLTRRRIEESVAELNYNRVVNHTGKNITSLF